MGKRELIGSGAQRALYQRGDYGLKPSYYDDDE